MYLYSYKRDNIIVHWLLCMVFFCIIQSLTTITVYRGSVVTSFSSSLDMARFAQVSTKVVN